MTVKKTEVHPEARAEITGSLGYYKEKDPTVAEDFDVTIDAAVLLIAAKPNTWPTYLHSTRRYVLNRFPYSIIYREHNDAIQIIALAHHRRKPGYWSKRVDDPSTA